MIRGQVSHVWAMFENFVLLDATRKLAGNFGLALSVILLPSKACLWIAIGHFYGKKWGRSRDSLRSHRKHSATGVVALCDRRLAIGGG